MAGYTELGAALLTTSGVFVALTFGITQITPSDHIPLLKSVKKAQSEFGKFIADGGVEATYVRNMPETLQGDKDSDPEGVRSHRNKLMYVLMMYSVLYFAVGMCCVFAGYSANFALVVVDKFLLLSDGFNQTKNLSDAFIIVNLLLFFVLYKKGIHSYHAIKDEIHLEYVEWSGTLILSFAKEILPQEEIEQNQGS